jgi:hypothetical protein
MKFKNENLADSLTKQFRANNKKMRQELSIELKKKFGTERKKKERY